MTVTVHGVQDRTRTRPFMPAPARGAHGEGAAAQPAYGGLVVRTVALTKWYGGTLALADLTMDVPAGQVLALLGPEGAGKTTTLRLLTGHLKPSSGRATVFGRDAWLGGRRADPDIGYLTGDLRLRLGLSGQDAVDRLAAQRGLNHDRRSPERSCPERTGLAESAEAAELAERLHVDLTRPVAALPRGDRQKIALLLALSGRPPLLLLDEPTAGLEALAQQELYAILRERARDGAAVLFTSHALSEVQQAADRVAAIRAGRLVGTESLETLRNKARHTVRVRFAVPPPPDVLDHVPGVGDVRLRDLSLSCTLRGSFDPLIKALSRFDVLDVDSKEADLEEILLAR